LTQTRFGCDDRCMTRARKLREVLNVRLDEALASEVERIARVTETTESEVARRLLAYGAEVERRLEAQELMRHHASRRDQRPGRIVIEARWEPWSDADLEDMGYDG
jgi:predicted transcriptional regulator